LDSGKFKTGTRLFTLWGCFATEMPHFITTQKSVRPYFRRRSGALEGIFVASAVGVVSGVWLWKPLLEEMAVNRAERESREALEAANGTTTPSPSNDKTN
jgi:hypothetical protein